MSDWRSRYINDDAEPLKFHRDVLLRLTVPGAVAASAHAERQGLSRQAWIRRAIVNQMLLEGAVEVPEMSPYTSTRVMRRPPHMQEDHRW